MMQNNGRTAPYTYGGITIRHSDRDARLSSAAAFADHRQGHHHAVRTRIPAGNEPVQSYKLQATAPAQNQISGEALPKPARNGKMIVVGNLKGGTGKSTIAVNLAGTLAGLGKSVALIDADPQATASMWLRNNQELLTTRQLPIESLASVPRWLSQTQKLLDAHDFVIVDLPAVIAPAMASGFILAQLILVPLSPSSIDARATERVLKHVRLAREERGGSQPKVLLVPTRSKPGDLNRPAMAARLAKLREQVAPAIRESSIISDAFEARRVVGQIAKRSPVQSDFLALSARVLRELEHVPPLARATPKNNAKTRDQAGEITGQPRRTRHPTAAFGVDDLTNAGTGRPWWQRWWQVVSGGKPLEKD